MSFWRRLEYRLLQLLALPLRLWVIARVLPDEAASELGLDPSKPTCYILRSDSLSDRLVLQIYCQRLGLPVPYHNALYRSGFKQPASFLSLVPRKKWWQGKAADSASFLGLLEAAKLDRQLDIQIVPVSVFWGRGPDKEKSLFKLLFSDKVDLGRLRKLLIVLVQGRQSLLHFGRPILLREAFVEHEASRHQARKLSRVLRVHFHRRREATLGPNISHRGELVTNLLATPSVRQAIQKEAEKQRGSQEKAEAIARRYANEIAADYSHWAINFLDRTLTWLWNKIYDGIDVHHVERLRQVAEGKEVVYVPSHRSHMDYLLLSYVLYYQGMMTPHIAAGINLDFWPVGSLLRRAGAFFMRRSFRGNQLYAAVFREYLHALFTKGYPVEYFPEGGRSRTGRLLQPKTGMLAMTVQSFVTNARRPIVFIPVYIGYDRVMEIRSYLGELRGETKQKESMGGLMKLFGALKKHYGKAYVNFGEPLHLAAFLDQQRPGWRKETVPENGKLNWLSPTVSQLAERVMTSINQSAVIGPVGLVGLAMLSTARHAMGEYELRLQLELYLRLLRQVPYANDVVLPKHSPAELIATVEKMGVIQRYQHGMGDLIYLHEGDAVMMTYYRNNIQHLLALPALVASAFLQRESLPMSSLQQTCIELYPLLQSELFLHWPESELPTVVQKIVDAFVEDGLLLRQGPLLQRPGAHTDGFQHLLGCGRILRRTWERYAITTAMLAQQLAIGNQVVERGVLERECQSLAERISLLHGLNAPEFFDKALFRSYIDLLRRSRYLTSHNQGGLVIDAGILNVSEQALGLLSTGMRQTIQHVTAQQDGQKIAHIA